MFKDKTVEDIMTGISNYPHVPYWFAVSKAAGIARLSLYGSRSVPFPLLLFVFDESYNLMGTLSLKDMLKWFKDPERAAGRQVSEIMKPVKFHLDPSDNIYRAAELMVEHELEILPVIEDKMDFVGVVSMLDVFDNLSIDLLNA